MTSRESIQTAIVIAGVWMIASALTSEHTNLVYLVEKVGPLFDRSSSAFSDVVALGAGTLILLLAVGVAPGAAAIYWSGRIAARIAPPSEAVRAVDLASIKCAAGVVLGLWFGVSGAESLFSALLLILSKGLLGGLDLDISALVTATTVRAAVKAIVGVALFRWGMREGSRAA